MPSIIGTAAAGFQDASLWESVKNKEATIKRMIDDALKGTTITVVCITHGITGRKWINYEIDKSLDRGNGLLGIQVHHLHDPINPDSRVGARPAKIEANGFKVYKYTNKEALARHIEQAATLAGH